MNSSNIGNLEFNFSVTHPDWSVTLIFFSVICGGLSILCGVFCVLSRIADFNLTRNAVYARKKFYAEKGDKLTTRKEKTQGKWISIIFNTQKILISSEYIKSEDKELINKKLANIIYWKDLLGVKTWLFHKIQIGFFSFMVIFWILSVFIN